MSYFKNNLLEGIAYYQNLFDTTEFFKNERTKIQNQIEQYQLELNEIEIPSLVLA